MTGYKSTSAGNGSVTDNSDNTGTVAVTDDAGVATAGTFIANLLANNGAVGSSRNVDPDADILMHDGNVLAAFTDSVSDPNSADCSTEIAKSDAGLLRGPAPNQFYLRREATGVDLASIAQNINEGNTPSGSTIFTTQLCFTNPDPCREVELGFMGTLKGPGFLGRPGLRAEVRTFMGNNQSGRWLVFTDASVPFTSFSFNETLSDTLGPVAPGAQACVDLSIEVSWRTGNDVTADLDFNMSGTWQVLFFAHTNL